MKGAGKSVLSILSGLLGRDAGAVVEGFRWRGGAECSREMRLPLASMLLAESGSGVGRKSGRFRLRGQILARGLQFAGEQGAFDGVVLDEAAAEAATDEVTLTLFGHGILSAAATDSARHRGICVGARFDFIATDVGGAVDWSMRVERERDFIDGVQDASWRKREPGRSTRLCGMTVAGWK